MKVELKLISSNDIIKNYEIWNERVTDVIENYNILNYNNYDNKFSFFFDLFNKQRIQKFFVLEKYRGQGIGTIACKKIIDMVKNMRCILFC